MKITEDLINHLIICEKIPIKAERRKMILENRHYKNNIDLISTTGNYKFRMFMRQSDEFIEDFSIGLIWTNANEVVNIMKPMILLRCQGPHDGKQPLDSDVHHSYHTHTLTVDDFDNKRYLKPSNRETTTQFQSFNQALLYFKDKCGIMNLDKYIELPEQRNQYSLLDEV